MNRCQGNSNRNYDYNGSNGITSCSKKSSNSNGISGGSGSGSVGNSSGVGYDADGAYVNAHVATSQLYRQGTRSRMCLPSSVSTLPQHPMRVGAQQHDSTLSSAVSVPQVSPPQQYCPADSVILSAHMAPTSDAQRPLSEEEVRWAFEGVSDLRYFSDPKFRRFVSSLP
ncbi:hypothetical protein EmuJ_001131400 [Echinococcus multilocularis]|uniref:Uncharacterized protein n=1 Tax=Echinococcus multilocularis TaxID=6211 RepID=U6I3I9_ECHMU|nr:hypothetical protein EmuJ_001131300 [Echinococcus multilocularis]CDS43550.1 hypothetical protein EmuJ_001131400 [Echinococcus multilocularis]